MLILTRRAKDKISFPQLGITIHFIRVVSGQTKVGVDAPKEVVIVRDEVKDGSKIADQVRKQLFRLPKEIRHGIRNELHEISIAVHLYKELMKAGQVEEADEIFGVLQDALHRLDENEILKRPDPTKKNVEPSNRIAIVEDSPNERDMLAGFLRLKGFEVETFEDGLAAMEHFDQNEVPDIVLMDMHMPRLDGSKTVQRMRATNRFDQTSIFAISGSSAEENEVEIGHKGVDQWFLKPLNSESLVTAIESKCVENAADRLSQMLNHPN